jgi:uncharacterized membrane protein (DUF2068 family)
MVEQTQRQRPLGVTIIAILLIIGGVLGLIATITGIIAIHSAILQVALIIGLIIAVAEIVLGWGLWTLKRWAFWATVIIEVINIIDAIINYTGSHSIASLLLAILIPVIILIYLFADRNVRAAFRV